MYENATGYWICAWMKSVSGGEAIVCFDPTPCNLDVIVVRVCCRIEEVKSLRS
jgi:hypothetical protein